MRNAESKITDNSIFNNLGIIFSKPKNAFLLIFLAVFIIYFQVFFFDFNIDDAIILDKIDGKINSFSALFSLWDDRFNNVDYRPLTFFSFGVENLIFGKINPIISHVLNVILFFFVAVLAYKLLNQLSNWKHTFPILLVVILFLFHPLNVEVVASIKSRDALLSLVFSLLSIIYLLKHNDRLQFSSIFFGLTFFLIALLAKLDAVGVLFFVPIYIFYNTKICKHKLIYSLVFFVSLFFVFTIRTSFILQFIEPVNLRSSLGIVSFTENPLVNNFSLLNRFSAFFQTHLMYIERVFYPINLRFYYGYDFCKLHNFFSYKTSFSVFLFLTFLFLGLYFGKGNKLIFIGFFGWISFLFYALNFVQPVAGIIADRLVFQSLLWLLFSMFFLAKLIIDKYNYNRYGMYFYSAILIFFGAISIYRVSAWKSGLTLVERDIKSLKTSFDANRIAAKVYKAESEKVDATDAKKYFLKKAIECAHNSNSIYPNNLLMNRFEGSCYFLIGENEKAKLAFLKAINVSPKNLEVNVFLGDVFYVQKSYIEALKYYKKGLELSPKNGLLINNISTVYYEKGEKDSCIQFSTSLIKKDSNLIEPWENLGYYFLAEKDTNKAKIYFRKAVKNGLSHKELPIVINGN
jgi:tetratricopeptide (TPR) repeat protein